MKDLLITSIAFLALLGTTPSRAQVTVDVTKVSCNDFILDKITDQKSVWLWLNGFFHGAHNNTVLDVNALNKDKDKLWSYCFAHQEVPVIEAVNSILAGDK